MTERESARVRLEQAVERLESAIGKAARKPGDAAAGAHIAAERDALTQQLSTLRTEHRSVSEQLQSLQQDYAALEKVVDQVTDRLDATMSRLRSVLDT